jgi:nucleotide-binding universal stress UspA family protein
MFERVLLCFDGSEAGHRALKHGAELARLMNAKVHVLSTVDSVAARALTAANSVGQVCLLDQEAEHRHSLEEASAWLRTRGIEARGYWARGGTIDAIARCVGSLSIDLIVMGQYPRPLGGGHWWSGRERQTLAERVNCCIFIAAN